MASNGHRGSHASETYWALQDLVRAYQFRDKDRVCGYGLTVSECYALECLAEHGPIMLNQLAAMLYSDKSSVSRIVTSLEKKGYSTREEDENDGRALRLTATKDGKALHQRIMRDIITEQQRVLAALPLAVRRGLPLALRKLGESAAKRCGTCDVEVAKK